MFGLRSPSFVPTLYIGSSRPRHVFRTNQGLLHAALPCIDRLSNELDVERLHDVKAGEF